MAYLSDQNTTLGQPAELSIFTLPANQVAIQKIYYSECRPVSSFQSDEAPNEIAVPGQGNKYIDLCRSRLYAKCRIVKSDGSKLAAKEKTGIVNIPFQSMWSQLDTYMNGKLVSLNTSYYPWKAYLKLLLSNGNDIATSQLQSQLFYLDDDDLEDVDPEAESNGGLAQRYQFTKESNIFDMEGPLCKDIFLMDKYLVNGVDIHLKLFRNRASFCFVSDETTPSYKLEIVDVAFKACMIKVDSGVLINHAEILKKQRQNIHFAELR